MRSRSSGFRWWVAACFNLLFAASIWAAEGHSRSLTKPNILIMVADDLGFADVGFNGGRSVPTPSLDRLAASGVRFADFRTCPMCSPTRAGLLTGRWPLRFGLMRAVVPPWSPYGLPKEEKTIADLLGSAGYRQRVIVGKWHLGHARREFLPLSHGFTQFYGHYNGAIDYFTHERDGERDWHRDDESVAEEGYATDLLGAEASKFARNAPTNEPWLLYLPFGAPHAPYQAKAEDLAKHSQFKMPERRAYAAMIDSMDQAIGKVLAAVEARADATNTLILFFSDNGGIPRVGSSNGPWRGAKLSVYEGATRVCAAIRWPSAGLIGGRTFEGRVGYIDILPTLLAAVGGTPAENVDGIDILPALRGTASLPDRVWYSYIHQNELAHASVHDGNWKLVAHGSFFVEHPAEAPEFELYDLNSDPKETTNVAVSHPEIVARLQKQLREFGKLQKPGVGAYGEGRAGFKAPKDWIIR